MSLREHLIDGWAVMLRPAIHQTRHGGRSGVQVLLRETKGGMR